MSIDKYRGYIIEGFAKPLGNGEFAAEGRVTLDSRVLEECDALGTFTHYEDAESRALLWAKKFVDRHEGQS